MFTSAGIDEAHFGSFVPRSKPARLRETSALYFTEPRSRPEYEAWGWRGRRPWSGVRSAPDERREARRVDTLNAPSVIEVIYRDAGNLVGVYGSLLLQVRSGALTCETIDRILAARSRLIESGSRVAMIAVLEEGAPIPDRAVRAYQKEVLGTSTNEAGAMAVAILGASVGATMLRTAARTNTLVRDRVRIASTVESACRWLAQHVGPSAAELREATDEARRRHREPLAP